MAIIQHTNKLLNNFYTRDVLNVAKDLLGKTFCKINNDGNLLAGRIVEVEAYNKNGDETAHSFRGKTPRNKVMFMGGGHLYIYFIYGMYYCANIVTGNENSGCAVLIRGIEPLDGIDLMSINRFKRSELSKREIINLTNGPGKICSAFGFTKKHDGTDLCGNNIFICNAPEIAANNIVETTRIGIKKSAELTWRFYIKENPFVSKK